MEEQLLKIFREVFSEVSPEEVNMDAEFREWDQFSSLTLAELMDKISSEMKVQIKLRSFIKAETIGEVLELLEDAQ